MIDSEKQGAEAVAQLLQDKNVNTRVEAYQFLQSLGPDAKEAVPALIAVLKKNQEEGWWNHSIETLAIIGPAAKDAIPELTKLLRSDDQRVRNNAMHALKKISPDDER